MQLAIVFLAALGVKLRTTTCYREKEGWKEGAERGAMWLEATVIFSICYRDGEDGGKEWGELE